jgi:hypothetical protein
VYKLEPGGFDRLPEAIRTMVLDNARTAPLMFGAPSDVDVHWKEFEDLGEDDVRKRLGRHIWDVEKERSARLWLEAREKYLAREANDLAKRANDVAQRANDLVRTNNVIATFALVGAGIAIAISILGLFLKR